MIKLIHFTEARTVQLSTVPQLNGHNPISVTDKGFVKIQHSFMIKFMNKLGSERSYINITKALHNKFTVLSVYVREN